MSIAFTEAEPGSSTSSITWRRGSVWTKNAIDLKNISTISITVDSFYNGGVANSESDPYVDLLITDTKEDSYTKLAYTKIHEAGTYSLDVRDFDEEYYVVLANRNTYNSATMDISLVVCQ